MGQLFVLLSTLKPIIRGPNPGSPYHEGLTLWSNVRSYDGLGGSGERRPSTTRRTEQTDGSEVLGGGDRPDRTGLLSLPVCFVDCSSEGQALQLSHSLGYFAFPFPCHCPLQTLQFPVQSSPPSDVEYQRTTKPRNP